MIMSTESALPRRVPSRKVTEEVWVLTNGRGSVDRMWNAI
jgi:hypothetical protein